MKILKNAGKFEVLNAEDLTGEKIINRIARAARTCYQSEDNKKQTDEALVKSLLKRGHHAMIEFGGTMMVRFSNISRGFTHEMVRHRLCSFAQESTRYVDESDLHVIVPPHKDENELVINLSIPATPPVCGRTHLQGKFSLSEWLDLNQQAYRSLRAIGWKPEDARQVLPIATCSQICVGANLREWGHIFDMRCSSSAHWEIRGVMLNLLEWCKINIPLIFNDFKILCKEGGEKVSASRMGYVFQ